LHKIHPNVYRQYDILTELHSGSECFLAAPFRRRINENWEVTLWLTRPPRNRLCANRLRFISECQQDGSSVRGNHPALAGSSSGLETARGRTFRLNRVDEGKAIEVTCGQAEETPLPGTYVQYEEKPKEHKLSAINAVLNVHTRISDLFSKPYDQIGEQLRLIIENVKERQESELLNNADYGFLHNVAPKQHLKTRTGPPTPDDLDELLTKVWKSRRSSWLTRAPSRRSDGNARFAAFHRPPSRCSETRFSHGGVCR